MCCMQNWDRLKCTPLEFGNIDERDFRVEMWSVGVKNLHKGAGAQEMPHLLQDLFLKYVPRDRPLQIQNKWITKPARSTNSFTRVARKRFFQSGTCRVPFSTCDLVVRHRLCYTPAGQSSQPAHCSCWDSEVGWWAPVSVWVSCCCPCRTSGCSGWDLHVGFLQYTTQTQNCQSISYKNANCKIQHAVGACHPAEFGIDVIPRKYRPSITDIDTSYSWKPLM